MPSEAHASPQISLSRAQWIRLVVVGLLAVFAIARVAADGIRVVYPLSIFGYVTDGNGTVVRVAEEPAKGSQRLLAGDRVRLDRIKPFDRKPGLAGMGSYTYDDPDRRLPIERAGHERIVHLIARAESVPSRVTTVIKILLFIIIVGLGAILFLVQPSIATAAVFVYCLGAEFPTTYAGLIIPNPWRQIPEWIAFTLTGVARAALVLFALCFLIEEPRVQRLLACAALIAGFLLGTLHAYADWRFTYGALPSQPLVSLYALWSQILTALMIAIFIVAFVRAHGDERPRIAWIVVSFALAGAARLASDSFFPTRITPWENGLLLTLTALPIAVVWLAVIRHNYFNVDFVVSRAIVYVALTASVIGTISLAEEIGTYVFYQNTDLAYGFLIAISMGIGSLTGKIRELLDRVVDRFIFRHRREQRLALEFIAGYILDAETTEDVYRALLEDATHALKLAFGGILSRRRDGAYELSYNYGWPDDCVVKLPANDDLTKAIARSRGALTFSSKETKLIKRAFPTERLTFIAPLFFDRSVSAIVVYGRNVSGLDLDPDERELLVRVIAHASIALNTIELERYRSAASTSPDLAEA